MKKTLPPFLADLPPAERDIRIAVAKKRIATAYRCFGGQLIDIVEDERFIRQAGGGFKPQTLSKYVLDSHATPPASLFRITNGLAAIYESSAEWFWDLGIDDDEAIRRIVRSREEEAAIRMDGREIAVIREAVRDAVREANGWPEATAEAAQTARDAPASSAPEALAETTDAYMGGIEMVLSYTIKNIISRGEVERVGNRIAGYYFLYSNWVHRSTGAKVICRAPVCFEGIHDKLNALNGRLSTLEYTDTFWNYRAIVVPINEKLFVFTENIDPMGDAEMAMIVLNYPAAPNFKYLFGILNTGLVRVRDRASLPVATKVVLEKIDFGDLTPEEYLARLDEENRQQDQLCIPLDRLRAHNPQIIEWISNRVDSDDDLLLASIP